MDKNDPRREPSDEELDDLNEHWHDPADPDGVVAAEEQRKWREEHPIPASVPKASRQKRRWPLVLLLLILLVIIAGGIYYWHTKHTKTASSTKPTTHTSNQQTTQTPSTVATKHYDSTNFALGLDYPGNWKLNDTATKMSIISPAMQLTTVANKTVSGHLQVSIQPKQTTLPEFAKGAATAVVESQKLTYKKPTANQRAQTYISFLGYASTASGSFDAIYVTGNNGYTVAQNVPMSDVVQTDPLVTINFVSCTSEDCASGTVTPISLQASAWKDAAISKPITALLESLSFN